MLFNRYVWLADTIRRAGRITFEEINDLWTRSSLNETGEDMPLRTFHNHRAAIEKMFYINIGCDKRSGYVYYIDNEADIRSGKARSWMLNAISVGNLLNESQGLQDRILFENIPSGEQYLSTFMEAIKDNFTVKVTYQGFERAEPHTFELEPYCLKVFRQRWYVLARHPKYESLRIYSLDRVQHLEITQNHFDYPADFSPDEYFYNSFGITVEDPHATPEIVEIKAYNNQQKYFKTLPLHHSQKILESNEEYGIFQYRVHITYDFIKELFSCVNYVEVLKPESLRQEFAKRIKVMRGYYE